MCLPWAAASGQGNKARLYGLLLDGVQRTARHLQEADVKGQREPMQRRHCATSSGSAAAANRRRVRS